MIRPLAGLARSCQAARASVLALAAASAWLVLAGLVWQPSHRSEPDVVLPSAAAPPTLLHDSAAEALRHARRLQARFEWHKRRAYPLALGSAGSAPCDEQVGRFCLRFSGSYGEDALPPPPADSEELAAARAELIEALERAAGFTPADRWLTGQRVRYLLEVERYTDALAAARACAGDYSWCEALAGWVHHAAGRYDDADASFAAALAALPGDERCAWDDMGYALEHDMARRWRRAGCAGREPLARRIWWLADPLYVVPGNAARTEHYTRRVQERVFADGAIAYDVAWGDDLAQILIRYGWPSRFERAFPRLGSVGSGEISGRFARPAQAFLPPQAIIDAPWDAKLGGWSLEDERARSRYPTPRALRLERPEHQLARFERGDATRLVAAFDVPELAERLDGLLLVQRAEDATPHADRRVVAPRDALVVSAPPERALVSLELLHVAEGRAYRARYGVSLERDDATLRVSDVLLLRATDALPERLEDALAHVRGSARVARVDSLAVYWEVYGGADDPRSYGVAVSVVPAGRGVLRRAGEALGLVTRPPPVSIRWTEAPLADRAVATRIVGGAALRAHALAIGLSDLPAGRYDLSVSITPEGGQEVTAGTELVLGAR